MLMGERRWLKFEVRCDQKLISSTVCVRISSGLDPEVNSLAPCHSIELISSIGGAKRSKKIFGSAVCEDEFDFRWRRYRRAFLTAKIRATSDCPEEIVTARHVPGLFFQGACAVVCAISELDLLTYIASHEDLIKEMGQDIERARSHYSQHGRYEDRALTFDPLAYLASYSDLSVFGDDQVAACRHFIDFGFAEGRTVSFQPDLYLRSNPDLIPLYVKDERGAILHYVKWGRQEGRPFN
jgi:hypothetical protein